MRDDPRETSIEHRLKSWAGSRTDVQPSPEILQRIQRELRSSLVPVNPLPGESKLVATFLGGFAACAAGLIAVMDKTGFHLMTAAQIVWMAVILAAGGLLFSLMIAWQMVPASRHRFSLPVGLALCGLAVIGGVALLFPWRTPSSFVSEGWPCAAMELVVAVPAAFVFFLLARRGALWGSAGIGATLSGLAAVLALTALQGRCMFQQAPHLLVWHAGTAAILIGSGALIGHAIP